MTLGGSCFLQDFTINSSLFLCAESPPPNPPPPLPSFLFHVLGVSFWLFSLCLIDLFGRGGGEQFSSRFGISVYKLNSLKIHFCHLNLTCMTFWTHKLTCFPQFIPPRLALIMKWEKRSYFVCIFHDIKNNDSCLLEYVCFELLMVSLVSFPMMEICQNVSIIFSNIP